ncbi:hypothetical protein J6590_083733 [Homalodisca vitripennis]|nr:hypothetical protein J6590_083733 [Homalodisca vitripennis]
MSRSQARTSRKPSPCRQSRVHLSDERSRVEGDGGSDGAEPVGRESAPYILLLLRLTIVTSSDYTLPPLTKETIVPELGYDTRVNIF